MADDLILDDPITPDHEDWTWVLQRPCSECGVDVSVVGRDEIADLLRCTGRDRVQILAGDPTELRRRPRPDAWSEPRVRRAPTGRVRALPRTAGADDGGRRSALPELGSGPDRRRRARRA